MLGDGEAGVLVQAGQAEALAKGMLAVLHDAGLQAQLAIGARQHSMAYRWPALAAAWLRVYEPK
jgi:glycosyltransferase involved in cell wall biosynthesis